jgi:hypothetical protein
LKFFEEKGFVEKSFSTPSVISEDGEVYFDYKNHHYFEKVNEEILAYLLQSNVR